MKKILLLLTTVACQFSPEIRTSHDQEFFDNTVKNERLTYASVDSIELSQHLTEIQLAGTQNIGEFFDHRLRFYKIDHPDLVICGSRVNKLLLYFIDSTLVRLRYDMAGNISNQLLDSLGLSKFKPLDDKSKQLLRTRTVYNKIQGKLNDDLTDYELIWYKGDAVSRFRVHDPMGDSVDSFFFFTEMIGYKKKVRELEIHYNYLEANLPSGL
ncbi:hypothetical protein FNH22_16675 [Fulvivirga sp. M361]|uniref:hypothetical protein n=1 Tax=Fulvivirga sp. M361 TaxID=2594266 RepID=UPI00117B1C3F|nr:hypothetical protein [Fulvivirga sp. M361]TRX56273.1 hypothetical protein FNH22_16675 [Fulvivirga sp. M361]